MLKSSTVTQILVACMLLLTSKAPGQATAQASAPAKATAPSQTSGDLYFDVLTKSFYREMPNGAMQRLGRRPGIRATGPVGFHVLNVNTYQNNVVVNAQNVTLYQESPGFSPAGWLGSVLSPKIDSSLKSKWGVTMKDTKGQTVDTTAALQQQITNFNAQCSALNEIGDLDDSLKCIAAHDSQTLVADPVDPRKPGLAASEHTRAKLRKYMQALFNDTQTQTGVQLKGTATVTLGVAPTQSDLLEMAKARIDSMQKTFTGLRRNYLAIRQRADGAAGGTTTAPNSGTIGGPVQAATPKDTVDPDSQAAEDQLDTAYEQAEYNVSTIQGTGKAIQTHVQNAATVYNQMMTQNIYQYDDCHATDFSNGDLVTYDIQIYDAKTPPPSDTAQSIIDGPDVPATAAPGGGTTPPASGPGANPQVPGVSMVTPKATKTSQSSQGNTGQSGNNNKQENSLTLNNNPTSSSGSSPQKSNASSSQSMQPGQVMGRTQPGTGGGPGGQSGPGNGQTLVNDIRSSVYVTGKLKVDFSTGFMFSNVVNWNYGYRTATKTGNGVTAGDSIIVKGSHDTVNATIGGLAHVYITSANLVVPALSFGAGQTLSGTLQYFIGPSLLIGHDQRFVLTAGWAGGPVQRLSAGEYAGEDVGVTKAGASPSASNLFRTGYFIGLTYNLTH